jgi:hypothetical protein
MTTEKLAELKLQCAELQHGAALFLLSCDISPSIIRMSTEVSHQRPVRSKGTNAL